MFNAEWYRSSGLVHASDSHDLSIINRLSVQNTGSKIELYEFLTLSAN